MTTTNWQPELTAKAQEIWRCYEKAHNLSEQEGKIAAVDPNTGQVWIGDTPREIQHAMRSVGATSPVYLVRIGTDHFIRKGRH
jgi:hypothetical protein